VQKRRRNACIIAVGVLLPIAVACGTSAVGVDDCIQIETARCTRAVQLSCGPDSGINLETPATVSNDPADLQAACIRDYNIACLHGTAATPPASTGPVTQCVMAIAEASTCGIVANPQDYDACAWLNPTEAAAEAASDAKTDSEAESDAEKDSATDAKDDTKADAKDAASDAKADGQG
jgi:hypothetical protein